MDSSLKRSPALGDWLRSPKGSSFDVDLSKVSGLHAVGCWFNPRTGENTRINGVFQTTGVVRFTPPSNGAEDDWVLVLDDEGSNFAPPGEAVRQ